MEEIIQKYLEYLKNVKHYSERTISSYYFDLSKFNQYLLTNRLDYDHLIDKDVQEYINNLRLKHYAISSLNRKIVCLRNFYKYCCVEIDNNISNPMINYKTLKSPIRLPKDLFDEQIKVLIQPNEHKKEYAIRNQCLILLLLNTGIRVSECANLDIIDVDLIDNTVRVLGKGNKERLVFFMPSVSPFLQTYLQEIRPKLIKNSNEQAFFIGSKGSRLTTRAIENILNDRAKQSKTPFKVTPHMLRHSFATNLLNNDVDIKIVQELLGHSSLSTTQIYTHVSKAKLKKVYEDTHPMAKALKEIKQGN